MHYDNMIHHNKRSHARGVNRLWQDVLQMFVRRAASRLTAIDLDPTPDGRHDPCSDGCNISLSGSVSRIAHVPDA
jgi:hypothetical protein